MLGLAGLGIACVQLMVIGRLPLFVFHRLHGEALLFMVIRYASLEQDVNNIRMWPVGADFVGIQVGAIGRMFC